MIEPPLKILVPPVPTTSKSSVPPESVILLLIKIFPPVLGAIPNVPELIVNAAAFVSDIVSRSPASIAPPVTKSKGVAALNDNTFVTTFVVNVIELVPDNILTAPIVWLGTFAIVSGAVALNASISFARGLERTGDQLLLTW